MSKKIFMSHFPHYVKYFFIVSNILLTFFILIHCQAIIKPILAAFIVALLLKPISTQLEKIKLPRLLSSLMAMLLMLIAFTALSLFLFFQIKNISSDINSLITALSSGADKIQKWTSIHFGIDPNEQIVYIKNSSLALLKESAAFIQNTLAATADFFTGFFLFAISVFFLLYYRSFLISFLFKCFSDRKKHPKIQATLKAIGLMVRKYVTGLLLVILITASLNTIGLLILGIKHAIFFGCLAGLLTVIPYIGIIIAALLPFLFALATTSSFWYPLGVIMIFSGVQFLEGNFITPNIIGNQISLNPFVAFLVLFFSGTFFGLLGIVLSLPLLAITKIIFDNIDSMEYIGSVLGNPPATQSSLKKKLKHFFIKK